MMASSAEEECKKLREKLQQLKKGNESLKSKQYDEENNIRHTQEFWDDIERKLIVDPDAIKQLIRNGTIKMEDKSPKQYDIGKDYNIGKDYANEKHKRLIDYALDVGNYDISQLCLNLGAIPPETNEYSTKPHHCQQLISSSNNGANIGDKIENITSKINQQNGIIENIMNELNNIGDQSKEIFNKIIIEMMINIIEKKLIFCDDLLVLSWTIQTNKGDPLQSEIWKTITKTCSGIIKNKNKRDWYWLKTYMLPSKVK